MKKNVGQLLIESGVIDTNVLDEALKRQVIFGGRLGTNLLEMGVISEEALMKILSFQSNVPYAEFQHFEAIPREILEALPRALIVKHRIVPLALESQRITVAMTDPQKLDIIDEVAFQTNMVVIPVLASEVRIVEALEKYYGIRREARFVFVSKNVAEEQKNITMPDAEQIQSQEDEIELVELTEADIEPIDPFNDTQINQTLIEVTQRDDVGQVVIRTGLRFMDDAFMFIIKGNQAHGWMSGGSAKPVVDFGSLTVPMDTRTVFSDIGRSPAPQRFNGVDLFESNPWIKVLSLKVPKEVMIFPIVLKTHMISALLGFSFDSPITDEEAAFLLRIMQKASVAFEILIVKSHMKMLEGNLDTHISNLQQI